MLVQAIHKRAHMEGGGIIHANIGDKGEKFTIVEMSADGIKLRTSADLFESEIINMRIQLPGYLFTVNIDAIGKVIAKYKGQSENIYEIEFAAMSDSDKEDIDELIRNSI